MCSKPNNPYPIRYNELSGFRHVTHSRKMKWDAFQENNKNESKEKKGMMKNVRQTHASI